ncbi:hypothetical protein [Streptomyces sp. NPDC046821]
MHHRAAPLPSQSHFKGLSRQTYANRSMIDNAMRITEDGEAYLRSL